MQALILEQQDGKTISSVQTIDASRLPQGDVTVDIQWSSLCKGGASPAARTINRSLYDPK